MQITVTREIQTRITNETDAAPSPIGSLHCSRVTMGSVSEDQASVKSEDLGGPRVKFLCSHGGKILPRLQDGHLRYVGGETRLVAVNRTISYSELMAKLHKLFGPNLYFKYQLPNEDLDALISVTCDEDVENMMDEHDKNEAREGSSRLRTFLFPASRSFAPGVQDFLDEPKSPDQKHVEAMSGPRTVLKVSNECSVGGAFQVPDFLFGLDPANYQQQKHHRQQVDGEVFSPTHVHSPTYREPPSPSRSNRETSSVTSFVSPVIDIPQTEYLRQPTSLMDTGVRGPALSTSALGPLIPNPPENHYMWDTKKVWDGGFTGEQRGEQQKEERRSGELMGNANYITSQHQESGVESGLQRVSSKDRLSSHALDGSPSDPHSTMDRHTKIQIQPLHAPGLVNSEKHKPEEVHMDVPGVPSELREGSAVMSGGMFQRSGEMQRGAQQANLGAQGYDGTSDRPPESRGNSGDLDQELYQRMDGQVVVDNVLNKISTTRDSQAEVFKYQDAHRVENMMLQQQNQGDFEVSLPLPPHQSDVPQHMHLGKGHFQQVYWQACDPHPQDQQQQPPHDALRLLNAAPPQRIVPPHTPHLPLSGVTVHHHCLPSAAVNTGKAVPRIDALPNARVPSPLYRQAGNPAMMRTDLQQLSRAVSPLRDNAPSNGPLLPLRYGAQVAQVQDNRVLRPATDQQPSGLPVTPPYLDFSEPHAAYEQVQYSEMVTKGNHDTGIGQVHYSDKIVMANHDQTMGLAHYVEENLKANPQYMRLTTFQDTQVMHPEGFYPHQESASFLSHH